MKNLKILNEERRIKNLISKAAYFTTDLEGQSDWARYLCVIISGYIENFTKELYIEYANKQVSAPVAYFISGNLNSLRNPKSEKLCEIAGKFKIIWKSDLEAFLNSEGRGDALDSIINLRHLIAHGKSKDANITLSGLKQYFDKIMEVAQFIEDKCDK